MGNEAIVFPTTLSATNSDISAGELPFESIESARITVAPPSTFAIRFFRRKMALAYAFRLARSSSRSPVSLQYHDGQDLYQDPSSHARGVATVAGATVSKPPRTVALIGHAARQAVVPATLRKAWALFSESSFEQDLRVGKKAKRQRGRRGPGAGGTFGRARWPAIEARMRRGFGVRGMVAADQTQPLHLTFSVNARTFSINVNLATPIGT